MNGYGVNIVPLKLLMTETGRYQQQVFRPITTHIGANAVDQIAAVTRDFANVNTKALRDIAGNIIKPSTEAAGNVGIQGGWGTRRFRFIMTVAETNPFNHNDNVTRVLYGYTDEGRMDASGRIDPNQRFYFNSETVIINRTTRTPAGVVVVPRVLDSNQIINGFSSGETRPVYGPNTDVIYTIRPEDVYVNIQNNQILANMEQASHYNEHPAFKYSSVDRPIRIVDERNQLGSDGEQKLARRMEHAPAVYLEEVLRGYKEGLTEAADATSMDSVAGTAQAAIANRAISLNNFLAKLRESCAFGMKGYVTYGELCQVFPDLMPKTRCVSTMSVNSPRRIQLGAGGNNQFRGNGLSDTIDSNHWLGANNETIAVTMIGQIVPAIMANTMFETIAFTAFNGQYGANDYDVRIVPESIRMITDGLNALEYGNMFISQLKDQVLTPITFGNQRSFSMTVSCDIAGETIVEISLDGGPMERWVAPSFADSLMTSLATPNGAHSAQISGDMEFLVTSAASNQQHKMGYADNNAISVASDPWSNNSSSTTGQLL